MIRKTKRVFLKNVESCGAILRGQFGNLWFMARGFCRELLTLPSLRTAYIIADYTLSRFGFISKWSESFLYFLYMMTTNDDSVGKDYI